MARGWKRGMERILVGSGVANALGRRHHPAAVVLAYHNIVPTGEPLAGDLSLHVDQRTFGTQLDFLTERYDVVPLDDLLANPDSRSERQRVAITFDDAYGGTMTAGLDELRARGLPATVFVPPGLLGTEGFWWDVLAPREGAPLSPEIRNHALWALDGRQAQVLAWAAGNGLPKAELPPHARPVTEAELLETARQEGISLGAHTWEHPNLAALPTAAVAKECEESKTWLRSRAPRYIEWLAYPYGLRTDEVVAEAAERFEGAVLIEGGLARSRGHWLTPPHAMPRVNVSRGLTLEGMTLRLTGLLR